MIYIYALKEIGNNNIRYVGKTIKPEKRFRFHKEYAMNSINPPKTHCGCWIKSVINNGSNIEMIILDKVSEDKWEQEEKFYISYFKFLGFDLVNHTSGGQAGPNFYDLPKEKREEVRKKYKPVPPNRKGSKMPDSALKITLKNLISKTTSVLQYDKEGNFIKQWDTLKEVENTLGVYASNIRKNINGKRTHAGGFIWKEHSRTIKNVI